MALHRVGLSGTSSGHRLVLGSVLDGSSVFQPRKHVGHRRDGRGALAVATGALWMIAVLLGVARADDVVLRPYVVQKGDTCGGIARKLYGDARRFDLIHAHNPGMGPTPHKLVPGTVLMMPEDPDARVTATVRRVQAQPPQAEAWQRAEEGLGLYRGWRVNTLERANAEVTFRDASALFMRENTLVVIFGGATPKPLRGAAVLEKGELRSFLGDLRLDVRTPSSQVRLTGGEALLAVDASQESRVSNFDGGNAALTSVVGGTVFVRPGYGSKVVPKRRPSRPKPLPATPTFAPDMPTHFASISHRGGSVEVAWQPVPQASAYRVELALDPEGRRVVFASQVPAEVTRLQAHYLAEGTYHVRLASVDAERFESRPSPPQALVLSGLTLREPGATDSPDFDPGDPSVEPDAPRALLGSLVEMPEGLHCALPGVAPARTLQMRREGRQNLRCQRADGAKVADLEIVVERLGLRPLSAPPRVLSAGESYAMTLRADRDIQALPITVRSAPCLGAQLAAGEHESERRLSLRTPADCHGAQTVEVQLAAAEGGQPTTLYRALVHAPSAPATPAPTSVPAPEETAPSDAESETAPVLGVPPSIFNRFSATGPRGPWVRASLGAMGSTGAGAESAVRALTAVEGPLLEDRLSLRVGYVLDLLRAPTISRDNRAAFAALFLHGSRHNDLQFSAAVGLDIPTGDAEHDLRAPRLRAGVLGGYRLGAATRIRFDHELSSATNAWNRPTLSGSYGLSSRLWGPLAGGAGVRLLLGNPREGHSLGAASELSLTLTAGALAWSVGGHVALTDDMASLFGRLGALSTLTLQL